MAKPMHPARRPEPGALAPPGLSILLAAVAAGLLLAGHPLGGGIAGLGAAVVLAAGASPAGFAAFAAGAAEPLVDAAVLAPLAWTERAADPRIAALALVTLGVALVAGYERARSASLSYRTRRSALLRGARQALPAVGAMIGGTGLAVLLWVALAVAGLLLVVGAANVAMQERHPGVRAGQRP